MSHDRATLDVSDPRGTASSRHAQEARGQRRYPVVSAARARRRERVGVRIDALDRVRGLAVLLMVLDHLALFVGGADWLRLTLTRAAVPLFMVLAGHLLRRWSWRLAWVAVLGAGLAAVVPWIDRPNVLTVYALGACAVLALRSRPWALWLLLIAALTWYANGFGVVSGSYAVLGVAGLLVVGQLLPLSGFLWGDRLPAWFGSVGRFPLSVYVGHVLVLEGVRRWIG